MTDNAHDVVIFGSGGFGREVAWALEHPEAKLILEDGQLASPNLLGFLDDDEQMIGQTVNGYPVLGDGSWIAENKSAGVILGIGSPMVKEKVVPRLIKLGASFPSFVDPRATVGEQINLGRGVLICAGAIATCNIEIGDFTMVNLSVTIGHDVKLGRFVTLSPAVNLSGFVEVGDASDLGTDCTVIPGKKIGRSAVIGAMACVTSDIPDGATAVGIPAKVIKIES